VAVLSPIIGTLSAFFANFKKAEYQIHAFTAVPVTCKCIGCHAFACNRDGHESYAPKLGGLFGRKAGGVEDYTGYSDGYKNSKIIWTDETLDEFFKDPGNIDPESIMADKGNGKIDTAEHRQQIIAYLKTEDPTVNFFCSK